MKRFLLVLLVLLAAAGACAEEMLFAPGEPHRSHLDFRQYFETMSAQTDECTICIAKVAFDAEEAQRLYEWIQADEAALSALTALQPHTIYVVSKLPAGLQRIENAVYCTPEAVLDGSYRPWLAEAALELERWQAVGLAGVAFGIQTDKAALAGWYADNTHDDMLSLFPAYFTAAFASEGEMQMAEQTAVSLMQHMIEQVGVQAALEADASAYVQTWLTANGIDRPYQDRYAGLLDGYAYTHNQFYPLIATSPKGDVFKLVPLQDMANATQVRMALCELEIGAEAILAAVKQDAPEWYERLAANYAAPITYEFAENGGYSTTYWANRRVAVGGAVSLIHETAHMMTPCKIERISRYMDQWKVEAIAEHLTHTYYGGRMEQETIYTYMQDSYIDAHADPDARAFYARAKELYLEHAPAPEAATEVRLSLWWRAAVLAREEQGEQLNSVSGVYAGAGSASLDAVNGNELSYTETEWLASYLVNRQGLSVFLHYCLDEGVSFEDAYGITYEAAKAEWLENRSMLD